MATQVGVDILKQGGNAVDAAVAVEHALAVARKAGNLGGGDLCCCALRWRYHGGVDFREMAPAGATRVFSTSGVTPMRKVADVASGIRYAPGTAAGFSLALEYGTMPLNKVVRPAMKLAEKGFVVNDALADDLKLYGSEVIPNHEGTQQAIFWKDGEPLRKGDKLVRRIWRKARK